MQRIKKLLFSMKTGLIILLILIIFCVIGSVLPQGELEAYYHGYYPSLATVILLLQLDDVFHSWWFIVLTVFLCLNLLGCNLLHFPMLLKRMKNGFTLEHALLAYDKKPEAEGVRDAHSVFEKMGFRDIQTVEREDGVWLYSVRNKIGIWGAWLTHLGMLIIIVGFSLGQIFTVKYTVYGVPGQEKAVENTDYLLRIDDFSVELREDETVEQYTSHVTVTDTKTNQTESGETSVNHPARLFGMEVFQNSTGWAADVEIYKNDQLLQKEVLCAGEHIAVADLPDLVLSFRAFYPDYIKGVDGMPASASSNLNNPAYLYALYYQESVLGMNVLRQGEEITVEDYKFVFDNPRSYSLIQLKRDPYTSIPLVGAVILLAALFLAFYVRTEEVWAYRDADGTWSVSGYSRKGSILFAEKLQDTAKGN